MINTVESVREIVEGTLLKGQKVIQLEIPESEDCAFAIEVTPNQAMPVWSLLRSRLEETGRYPVLCTSSLFRPGDWEREMIENSFFSRFEYGQEAFQGEEKNLSPEAIIARVPSVDLTWFLRQKAEAFEEELAGEIEYALAEIQEQFGVAPNRAEIEAAINTHQITVLPELERWLFNWELEHVGQETAISAQDVCYLDWYPYEQFNETPALLLLPTTDSWNSLAYLHWFGAGTVGSDVAICFLKRWHERHDAELVYHHGTMLQFNVGKPPATPAAAFELAWEQRAIAPCTTLLPGVSLRDHAWSLMKVDRWFIHEKP